VITLGRIEELYAQGDAEKLVNDSKKIVDDYNQNVEIIGEVIKEILSSQKNANNRWCCYEWISIRNDIGEIVDRVIAWRIENSNQDYDSSCWRILLLSTGRMAYFLWEAGTRDETLFDIPELSRIEKSDEHFPIFIGEDKIDLQRIRINIVEVAVKFFHIEAKDNWLYPVSSVYLKDYERLTLAALNEILAELKSHNK